jgi:hypothetical protein
MNGIQQYGRFSQSAQKYNVIALEFSKLASNIEIFVDNDIEYLDKTLLETEFKKFIKDFDALFIQTGEINSEELDAVVKSLSPQV